MEHALAAHLAAMRLISAEWRARTPVQEAEAAVRRYKAVNAIHHYTIKGLEQALKLHKAEFSNSTYALLRAKTEFTRLSKLAIPATNVHGDYDTGFVHIRHTNEAWTFIWPGAHIVTVTPWGRHCPTMHGSDVAFFEGDEAPTHVVLYLDQGRTRHAVPLNKAPRPLSQQHLARIQQRGTRRLADDRMTLEAFYASMPEAVVLSRDRVVIKMDWNEWCDDESSSCVSFFYESGRVGDQWTPFAQITYPGRSSDTDLLALCTGGTLVWNGEEKPDTAFDYRILYSHDDQYACVLAASAAGLAAQVYYLFNPATRALLSPTWPVDVLYTIQACIRPRTQLIKTIRMVDRRSDVFAFGRHGGKVSLMHLVKDMEAEVYDVSLFSKEENEADRVRDWYMY